MPNTEDLITTAQAAAILRCSYRTVLRRAEGGELTIALRMPGRTGAHLFDAEEVKRLREADIKAFLGEPADARPA